MRNFRQNQYIYLIVLVFLLLLKATPCLAEFTIDDEKKLGKEFYDKMEEHQLLLKDKMLKDYVTRIGNLILNQGEKAPFKFNFLIVNSSAINAFATPGGYIYINKGLIMSAENEAELAGVIAHEIGHANGRHVASLIEKSKKLNVATLAAMLAGVFLGGGGDATAAIAAFAIAGSSSMTLRYMREHEEEADRMAVDYLVRAGYYPSAMIDFLKIMKQNEFISKTMPSYLLTHPGTDNRIIYLDSLISSQYSQKGAKNIIGNLKRVQASVPLDASEISPRYAQLQDSLKNTPNDIDLLYSLALTEDQLGETESALKHLQKALSLAPGDSDVLRSLGLIYIKTGNSTLAQNYLLRAAKANPANDDVMLALGKAYFASGQFQKALDSFLSVKDVSFDDTDINYFLAMTYGKLNNAGESHYYFGIYFKKEKKIESSLFHFKEALNYFPKNSERSLAIVQAIKELENPGRQKTEPKTGQP